MTREIRYGLGNCWLGGLLVAATDQGVCAILLGDNPDNLIVDLDRRFNQYGSITAGDADFERIVTKVAAVVDSPLGCEELELDLLGTPFQVTVWSALQEIPWGETVCYSEVADRIGRPDAVRAVGRAIGANPVSVIVPCHRVVGKDGSLTGYHWGLERKKRLLEREQELATCASH